VAHQKVKDLNAKARIKPSTVQAFFSICVMDGRHGFFFFQVLFLVAAAPQSFFEALTL
jgi:hypothetical protein